MNFDDATSSAATGRSFSVYSHIKSKNRNSLTNVRAFKLLYVSYNENLLKKMEKNRSIYIFNTVEDFEKVDWQEEDPNAEDNT